MGHAVESSECCCVSVYFFLPVTPLTPACSEWEHINAPGSQQHLTNWANVLRGHIYNAFLLFRRYWRLWKEKKIDFVKKYGHEEFAPIYIHQARFFSRRKHLLAPLSLLFFHLFVTVASDPPPPRLTPQAGVLCQTVDFLYSQMKRKHNKMELTKKPSWAHAWEEKN